MLQSHVADLAEDGNGFIWISTGSGVQRFDGKQFHQVAVGNGNKGLPDDKYVHFFRLKNGNLWITHNKGISEYDTRSHSFNTVYDFGDTLAAAGNITWCVLEDNRNIWCRTRNQLLALDKKDYHIAGTIGMPINSTHVFPSAATPSKDFVAALDSVLIFLPDNLTLQETNLHTRKTIITTVTPEQISFYAIQKLHADTLLVATGRGIEKLDLHSHAFSLLCKYKVTPQLSKQFFPIRFHLVREGLSIVMISSDIYELDTNTGQYISHLTNLQNQSFINNGYYTSCIPDGFNNLWALSASDGIKKINYNFSGFRYYGAPVRHNNFVKSILVDKTANLVFLGSYNYGLSIYDTAQQLLQHINTFPGAPPAYTVCGIDKVAPGQYLIYLMGRTDVYLLNTQHFTLQKVQVSVTAPAGITINKTLKRFDFYLSLPAPAVKTGLLQSYQSLYSVTYRPGQLQLQLLDTVATTSICAYQDRQQRVWVGGPGTYFLLSDTVSRPERATHRITRKAFTLPGKTLCRCFYNDRLGNLWMGTEKGLYLLNDDGTTKKIFGKADGLPDDCIYAIREDKQGNIWLSHNKGISCRSTTGTFRHFNKSDGLQENEFNTNTSFETADGELYFGGVNGISSFYPEAISNLTGPPRILLSGIKIRDDYWKNDTAYWSIAQLELPHNDNVVSFEFTALGLRNPDQYNYQYQLEGVDPSWINAGNSPVARYVLEPGKYIFRYYAGNSFSKTVKDYKQVVIIIHRPFWRTAWFTVAVGVIALILLVTIISFYNRQKYSRQLRELETQHSIQQERERISRELHDNIGAQLSFISSTIDWITDPAVQMGKDEEAQRLNAVNDTARHVINDLRETIWALKKEHIQADELADKIKLLVQSQKALQPQLETNIIEKIAVNTRFSPTEALNVFRICQEAVMNCIKHAMAQKLCITIECNTGDDFLITIADNGKGFTKQTAYCNHYGLENMEHRATELGATLTINTAPGQGTVVTLQKAVAK